MELVCGELLGQETPLSQQLKNNGTSIIAAMARVAKSYLPVMNALHRFFEDKHDYPLQLGELVPRYLKELSHHQTGWRSVYERSGWDYYRLSLHSPFESCRVTGSFSSVKQSRMPWTCEKTRRELPSH
jgi:hypothetical protein